MSLSDLIKLKDEQLSFEGELTSVVLSDEGGNYHWQGRRDSLWRCVFDLQFNP